jgi:hypothetical protein
MHKGPPASPEALAFYILLIQYADALRVSPESIARRRCAYIAMKPFSDANANAARSTGVAKALSSCQHAVTR